MKVIHTADWHLGTELNGYSRIAEQQQFLNWLVKTCVNNNADALVVAGDVFDVINPSIIAQDLFTKFIKNLKNELPSIQIVVTAGNHDSGTRLEVIRNITSMFGDIHIVGTFSKGNDISKYAFKLKDSNKKDALWCLAYPFLRPQDIEVKMTNIEDYDKAFQLALQNVHEDNLSYINKIDSELPVLAIWHLTTKNSTKAGSEKVIIGGVDSIDSEVISKGVNYVALGHIHKAQSIVTSNPNCIIKYSGSPFPIDFAEKDYSHHVVLVDIDFKNKTPNVEHIEIDKFVKMLNFNTIPLCWNDTQDSINSYDWSQFQNLPKDLSPFVKIQYKSNGPEPDLQNKVEALIAKHKFRLLGVPKVIGDNNDAIGENKMFLGLENDMKSKDMPLTIFQKYYKSKYNDDADDKLLELFIEVETEVRNTL